MNNSRVPSSRQAALKLFDLAWLRLAQALVEHNMSHIVSSKNTLTLHHGNGWEFARSDESTGRGNLVRSSADVEIEHEAQVSNDVSAYRTALLSFVEQFVAQMSRRAYESVSAAAEEVVPRPVLWTPLAG
jgi:hypothetical protein